MIAIENAIAQLDQLLKENSEHAPTTTRPLANRLLAAIERLTLSTSSYARQAALYSNSPSAFNGQLVGIATALRDDLKAGWSGSIIELVHADTYNDFLEMAEGLLDTGYKDAAAVIAGSSLEVHLKSLCTKHGVDIEVNGRPKKADTMNADLKKTGAYGTLEQKSVTAWLDLRNSTAHGDYAKYDEKGVDYLIRGIRDFMVKHPA